MSEEDASLGVHVFTIRILYKCMVVWMKGMDFYKTISVEENIIEFIILT